MKYRNYVNSSKSCWNALSMYKGRSVLIIFKIGDYCFLFAFPTLYARERENGSAITNISKEIDNNESKKYLQTIATLNCSEAYKVSARNTAPKNNLSLSLSGFS